MREIMSRAFNPRLIFLLILNIMFLLLGCSTTQEKTAYETRSISSIVKQQGHAVVLIIAYDESGNPIKFGSGFFVDPEGILITNYHVIEGAYSAIVRLIDGRTLNKISLIGFDSEWDIAVLKAVGSDLPIVRLGNSDVAQAGQEIVVIGNPEGLQNTVSDGLISSIRRLESGDYVFQISAPISEGSSGGPVYNLKGEVIGISTLMLEIGQNLNFAVPIKYALPLIEKEGRRDLASVTEELEKKRIEEYLTMQKASPNLEPEETLSKEARQYYEQAQEKAGGLFEFLGTDDKETVEFLKKAIAADQYYHAAHYVLGLSYMKLGNLEDAERELLIANSLKPLFTNGHCELGRIYYKANDFTRAIDEYRKAIELDPEYSWAYYLLGIAYRGNKEYKTSLRHFEHAIGLRTSSYPAAEFEVAITYSLMQDYENALIHFKKSIDLIPNYVGIIKGLEFYKNNYKTNKNNTIYLQNFAYIFFLQSDYRNAKDYFLASIKIDKTRFKCNYELGLSYFYEGPDTSDYAQAVVYLEKAVLEEPDNYDALMKLGYLYTSFLIKKRDYNKAITVYKKAIELKPDEAEAYMKVSSAYYFKKDYQSAKRYILIAITLDEANGWSYDHLGDIYRKENNLEKALENYDKAIEKYSKQNLKNLHDFDLGWILTKVGDIYEEEERYDEALEKYQEAYKKGDFFDYVESRIAAIYIKQEKYSKGISIYKKRVDKYPEDSSAHFDLANAYYKSGQIDNAINEYHKVLKLEPEESGTHYNLALAYLMLNKEENIEKIIFHFKEYLKMTKDKQDNEGFRNFAMTTIAEYEFPSKLKELKKQGGEIGALASLLILRQDYNRGNNQYINGINQTKYEDYQNVVHPDVFVAEGTFESLALDIKKVKTDDIEIQRAIDDLEKAVLFRIEGIKTANEAFYILKKDYKGEYERGRAKIKIADNQFVLVLKALVDLMKKKYHKYFSESEIDIVSRDLNYYGTKYKD